MCKNNAETQTIATNVTTATNAETTETAKIEELQPTISEMRDHIRFLADQGPPQFVIEVNRRVRERIVHLE